jgi:putative ABC transport system permease protein
MDFIPAVKQSFKTLLSRKLRSFLAILGIVIGVTGVIVIIAMGAGAQSLILGQVTKLGSNLLSVQPGKSNDNGPPAAVYGITVTSLVNSDADALRDGSQVHHVVAVDAISQGSVSITWQNQNVDTNLSAVDSSYPNVVNFTMQEGSFFSQQEGDGSANVVVLGSTVAQELFGGNTDPVGQVIKVRSASQSQAGGVPVRVVGVIASRGSAFFQDNDDQIFLPLVLGEEQVLGRHYLSMINIKVDSANNLDQTTQEIETVLNQRHHILKDIDADYTVRSTAQAVDILTTITSALSLFLTSVAAIALVVGGIGILNIMLASVAERTREVGLRKALGATGGAVMQQFLYEAVALTMTGGIIGIILGTLFSFIVSVVMHYLGYDWAFVVSPLSIILAVGVSVITGVIFGSYPAYKASKLNPIEALRYE